MRKIALLALILVGGFVVLGFKNNTQKVTTNSNVEKKVLVDSINYQGEKGKDALTLLKEKAEVEESQSGFVSSINGRAANVKNEFWAFYVNGKQAEVGAGQYQMNNEDKIEWKIEKFK